ncbi:CRAL-TRIO domain-containing protein [Crepidotus variabilis]|uniref:CRAL-TRIO domain-containing protein n=1 Tax=Crepidotus variabilis TaxID=179855 RepID=A0A9P6JSI7_9AGAR|nr:CRAL-TRIO domain-containing protein [Crepidotus variabilis]
MTTPAPAPAQINLEAVPMPPGVTLDPTYKPPPRYLGNLTVVEQHTLDKLRKELQDEGHFVSERMTDSTLLRFLRARNFDLAKSKEMFLSAEKWRKDFGVDDIIKNFDFKEKAEVDKYYPQFYHKTDKDGRPIYVERLGKLDVKALYSITTQERQLQRLVFEYERSFITRLPACTTASHRPIETFCTILDLGGVSLSNFYRVKDFVMEAAGIGQNRYPETMGKFYIINAPWTFTAVWSVIKGWLDPVTVAKIDIMGSSDYKEKLLKQIPPQNLPKEFGGVCECVGGCSLSDAGPWKGESAAPDATPAATSAAPAT